MKILYLIGFFAILILIDLGVRLFNKYMDKKNKGKEDNTYHQNLFK